MKEICPRCKRPLSLDKELVKEVYRLCKDGFKLSDVSRESNLSRQVVYAIREKKLHKKLTDEVDNE